MSNEQETRYADIQRVIQNVLDRDGQHNWDETARLTEVIAPAVWNEIHTFPLAHERSAGAARCDHIVNNGMGEPTECGRTFPCEYHAERSAGAAPIDVEALARAMASGALRPFIGPVKLGVGVWEPLAERVAAAYERLSRE